MWANPGRAHDPERVQDLLEILPSLKVTHLAIAGDLTTTSAKKEFQLAKEFISTVQEQNIVVFSIPGNHDHYTKRAVQEKRFFKTFEHLLDFYSDEPKGFTLNEQHVSAHILGNYHWLVLMDTTHSTPWFKATGEYTHAHDHHLRALLEKIPSDHNALVMNHFPLHGLMKEKHALINRKRLAETLSAFPQVKAYIHGHDHKAAYTPSSSYLTLNPGSLTMRGNEHFLIIDYSPDHPGIEEYAYTSKEKWHQTGKKSYG